MKRHWVLALLPFFTDLKSGVNLIFISADIPDFCLCTQNLKTAP